MNRREQSNGFYAGNGDTHIDKEKVDIFGDGNQQECGGDACTPGLPVPRGADPFAGAEHKKNSPAFIYMMLTVLFLTTAFTALASVVIMKVGNRPRESVGDMAGMLMFGDRGMHGNSETTPEVDDNSPAVPPDTEPATSDNSPADGEQTKVTETTSTPDVTSAAAKTDPQPGKQMIRNKTQKEVDPHALKTLFAAEIISAVRGKKITVICTHSHEQFADGVRVTDAARAFCQAISAVGIDVEMCDIEFDLPGRLGSYSRARAEVERIICEGETGLVVDLHIGNDPGLVVGACADDRWQINTALAAMIDDALDTYSTGIVLEDGVYNQDLPVLSLHAELNAADHSSRGLRAARILADAVIKLMKQTA